VRPRAPGVIGLALAAAIAGALLGAGVVSAQDMKADAQGVRDTNAALLASAPKTDPTADTVPGYAGQAPDQQTYYSNPSAMQDDGLVVAGTTGKDNYDLANQGTAAPGAMGVTGAEDWLKPSRDAHSDPMSLASGGGGGSVPGAESTECQTKTKTDTVVDKALYTCETSTTVDDQSKSCTASYQPQIVSYTATCTETFNDGTGGWDRSSECDTAPADPACAASPRVCAKASTPQVTTGRCQRGYVVTTETQDHFGACANVDTVTVDTTPPQVVGSQDYNCAADEATCAAQYPGCTLTLQSHFIDEINGVEFWFFTATCQVYGSPTTTVTDHWDNQCQSIDNGQCVLFTPACNDGPGTKNIDGTDVYRECWSYQTSYNCPTSHPSRVDVDTCGSAASLTQDTCAARDDSGACTLWNYTTTATSDPAGGCEQWKTEYSCKRQSGGGWVDDATCDPEHDQACAAEAPSCLDGPGTRVVDGVSVYSDCWQRSTRYECQYRSTSSDCNPAADCKKVADNCLDEPAPADLSQCLSIDHEYDCSTTTTTTSSFNQCGPKLCLQDTCYTMDRPENTEFQQVFSQLSAVDAAAKDHSANADLTVFKGENLKCRKAVVGFLNCCKDSGWGPSLGLASCNANEKKLMDMQDKKATHYVGTYCSKKALFGFCLEKSMSYCSYGGSLARIIQEAGHEQLPKSWGSTKTPDCSGFTIDEFTKLDLTNVDFSDFYNDKLKDFAPPDPGSTASNIQSSLDSLYATGKPSSGGPQ
jgi:hypothetical protein